MYNLITIFLLFRSNEDNDLKTLKLNAPIHIGDRAKIEDEKTTEQNAIWLKQNLEPVLVRQ